MVVIALAVAIRSGTSNRAAASAAAAAAAAATAAAATTAAATAAATVAAHHYDNDHVTIDVGENEHSNHDIFLHIQGVHLTFKPRDIDKRNAKPQNRTNCLCFSIICLVGFGVLDACLRPRGTHT